ncbi:MarR family winged helix-turn-helix transcriptional regulator [Sphingomonas sp.]|uniref:MarR family winged helix-turn-helix transcriptional regulator n=1 Tax=Sphingomonas sp. TaxID=28214 RepID=UPI003B3AA3E9
MKKSASSAGAQGPADIGLDRFLCFAVYSTGLAFNRVYKPLLDRLDLTYPQYLAMVALWQEDGQTVSQLGEKLFLESNTLTPLIKRLEAAGYVNRRRDTKDERVVRVSLTDAGRALAQQAACLPEQILQATGVSEAQLGDMHAALTALRTNLQAATTAGA